MKSGLWIMAVMLGFALGAWAADSAPLKVKVLKNNVNLRAKPVPTAEVVGQAAADDVLISKSMDSEWVEVTPPTNVDLWVLGDYVKEGVIQCSQKVNIRSGPGINFAIVGQLAPGDRVTSRGAMTEWVKIAPPEVCSLWVSRSLVEVVTDKPAKPEPVKPEAVKPAPVKKPEDKAESKPLSSKSTLERAAVPVTYRFPAVGSATGRTDVARSEASERAAEAKEKPVVTGDAPPDLNLIPSLGQGQWKQYDGTLRPRGVFARTPSRFRLVSYDTNGHATTVCYVKGNNDQLSTLINRPMIISGREYWVQRQNYPVLIPERIVLK